ncbi:DUF3782 domain-containing protein [uncultured Thiocystis sp.]|jgi:hypothetical protein|uniref:DUF3782 domain-containing protein n=1 Tax=uncultured Thiocystis sp. TaxID=1202134 RepID=UPI0025F25CE3|nr:DUF3782 domain-containing protein [uncultured Thiocystis sp.]
MATSYEEILILFRETDQQFKEIARRFQETDRKFQETDRKFQETDRKFQETFQETDRKLAETGRIVKELSKSFGSWHNRLGEFVEEMVRPAVLRLFRARGLEVHQVMRDLTAIGDDGQEGMEIDLLITNAVHAVAVECKSRLTVEDVQEHLSRLERFKGFYPQYAGYRLMGAVAAMVLPDEVARFAYRQGLFVLAQSGDAILVRNDDRFTPKEW